MPDQLLPGIVITGVPELPAWWRPPGFIPVQPLPPPGAIPTIAQPWQPPLDPDDDYPLPGAGFIIENPPAPPPPLWDTDDEDPCENPETDEQLERCYGPPAPPPQMAPPIEAFAPTVLPEVIVTPRPSPFANFGRAAGAFAERALWPLTFLFLPMASGGPRTGELQEEPQPPRKPPRPPPEFPPEEVPFPNWDEFSQPGRPTPLELPSQRPFAPLPDDPDIELDPLHITAPRPRPVEVPYGFPVPDFWPVPGPGVRPTPGRRTAPGREPQPVGDPGDELITGPNPANRPFPWDPTNPWPNVPGAPNLRPAPSRPTSPGPQGNPRPPSTLPEGPGRFADPLTLPTPQPDKLKPDNCTCTKEKKKKKKEPSDRLECFEYKVRQLRRGQINLDRKLISCEDRSAYPKRKSKLKKGSDEALEWGAQMKKKRDRSPTLINPFTQLWR